jgi:hypothetical protein
MLVSNESVLSYLKACAEKCNAEQHWVVASVTAVDAAFIAAAEHLKFSICLSFLSTVLLIVALLYGLVFIWRRHNDYYFYRDEIANMLKDKDYLARELREPMIQQAWRGRDDTNRNPSAPLGLESF